MKQFYIPFFHYRHRCWSGISSFSHFVCSLHYLSSLHLWKKNKNLKIPISLLSFVDDGLFISQEKSFDISNTNLFCSYNIMLSLLEQFELIVEYGKTEVFHFSRSYSTFNPHIWILVKSVVPFSILNTLGDILGLSSIENSYFVNISSFILIRLYPLSSIWKCLATLHGVFYCIKNIYSIKYVFSQSPYMVFLFSTTTRLYYCSLLKSLTKCNDEQCQDRWQGTLFYFFFSFLFFFSFHFSF